MSLALLAALVAVAGFVVAQATLLVKFGRLYGKMEAEARVQLEAVTRLERATERLEQIPLLAQRIGQLEEAVRRVTSDIRELRERTTEQRAKLESLHDIEREE